MINMNVNDIMEDEERGRQVIMKDGKLVSIRLVIDEILKKDKNKKFSKG